MPRLEDVQEALQRCLAAEPPVDFALSKDAAQLATVFAEMRFAAIDTWMTRRLSQSKSKRSSAGVDSCRSAAWLRASLTIRRRLGI